MCPRLGTIEGFTSVVLEFELSLSCSHGWLGSFVGTDELIGVAETFERNSLGFVDLFDLFLSLGAHCEFTQLG